MRSLTKSKTFSPDLPALGLIRAEYGLNGEKTWISRAVSGIILFAYTITTYKSFFQS